MAFSYSPFRSRRGDLPGEAGRQGDQSPAVLPQQRLVNAGLDVKALRPGGGHQLHQIGVAPVILAQQPQMAVLAVQGMNPVLAAAGGYIYLAA